MIGKGSSSGSGEEANGDGGEKHHPGRAYVYGEISLHILYKLESNRLTPSPRKIAAARAALKRKKQHENSLEQTNGQISMLEQQIYSIESANINQETLAAMKNAGAAMKAIHGKMTMEDVDVTMYVSSLPPPFSFIPSHLSTPTDPL